MGWNLKSFCKGFTFHRWFNLLLSDLHHKDSIPGQFRVHFVQNVNLGSIWHGFLWFPILKSDGSIPCIWQKERKVLRWSTMLRWSFLEPIIFREFLFAKPWGQRPYERLEYLKWVWELWQPLRSSLRLEKHLDQTQESMMSWVEWLLLWLFVVEKRSSWNMFFGRYHWISPQTEKRHGSIFGFRVSVGEKSQIPQQTRRLWQRWTSSSPGAQSKWCLGINPPWLKINLL